jgi:hypothetical protein
MSILLIQGCSKSKNGTKKAVPAIDLYSGYFFKIIKKAMREDEFDERIDIWILSAEHGLIEDATEIQHYDRRMDSDRAAQLAPKVTTFLQDKDAEMYDKIVVNVGNDYLDALSGLETLDDTEIHHIQGEGIGVKGHKLKQIIRGDLSSTQNPPAEKEMV